MKLTRRGKVVLILAYLAGLALLWWGLSELSAHEIPVNCRPADVGTVCDTAWK